MWIRVERKLFGCVRILLDIIGPTVCWAHKSPEGGHGYFQVADGEISLGNKDLNHQDLKASRQDN